MSIEKMEYINIVGLINRLDDTLKECLDSDYFHIEDASVLLNESDGEFKQLTETNPYKDLLKKLSSVNLGESFSFKETKFDDIADMPLEDITGYVIRTTDEIKNINDSIGKFTDIIQERGQALGQVEHLRGLNIDMEQLFQCKHICVRFGKLPIDSYQKLSYYEDKTFEFLHYDVDKNYYWGLYFTPKDCVGQIDKIFKSLYFERIWVPNFVTGTPEKEIEQLRNEVAEAECQRKKLIEEREEYRKTNGEALQKIFCRIKYLYDLFEYRSNAVVLNDTFYIAGFIPKIFMGKLKKCIDKIGDVSIVNKPPEEVPNINTPVKLKNNRFAKPFSLFVEMYGLPAYNGFNPTNFVAITYTILFGIMFGDLGQGLVLSLAGFIIYKKTKSALGAIMARIGFSSAFFGLIFGSVFGYEDLLNPLYKSIGLKHKPLEVMENTNLVLAGAIAIGVVLILISILFNIIISFRQKKYDQAVFGNNGIAGMVMFSALLFGLVSTMLLDKNVFTPVYIIFLIVLPILLMFFREPLGCLMAHKKFDFDGVGNFIAANFFEVFEFMLGYATNTLSFVRIGGFVFSHAGMMSVVMLLAEGASKGVSPVIIVFGNVFVMCMEGLIVGIQVLRLEFYEIFSRFYDGDGRAYEPMKVVYNTNID